MLVLISSCCRKPAPATTVLAMITFEDQAYISVTVPSPDDDTVQHKHDCGWKCDLLGRPLSTSSYSIPFILRIYSTDGGETYAMMLLRLKDSFDIKVTCGNHTRTLKSFMVNGKEELPTLISRLVDSVSLLMDYDKN